MDSNHFHYAIGRKASTMDLRKIRSQVDDMVKNISRNPTLKRGEALEIAKKLAPNLTKDNLTDWVAMGIVNPKIEEGDRNTHLYGRDQIIESVLASVLHYQNDLSYTDILSLLLKEARANATSSAPYYQSVDIELPNQRNRALATLRSRMFGVVLTWVLGKSIPVNTHVFLRKFTHTLPDIGKGKAKLTEKNWMDRDRAQNETGVIRPEDVIGVVSSELEVLFSGFEYASLNAAPPEDWYSLKIVLGDPAYEYNLMLGFDRSVCDPSNLHIDIPENTKQLYILGLLLSIIYAEGNDIEASEQEKTLHSTSLHSLAEIIPTLSSSWEYCAILAVRMNKREQLEVKAASHTFPKDLLKNLTTILIDFAQPLSGWAIENDYPIKVHQIDLDESWPVFQEIEKAQAGAAIPTHANNKRNGVLYIGTTKPSKGDEKIFDDSDIRVLQILSEVLGELIERSLIRQSIESNALRVINKPPMMYLPWEQLEKDFDRTLSELEHQNVGETDNLHLTVIKTQIDDETLRKHPGILSWYPEHILDTTWEFFNRNYQGVPTVYIYDRDNNKDFAIFIPEIQITNARDRDLRSKLKKLLCSLEIKYSPSDQASATAYLWTIPFRKDLIKSRLFGPSPVELSLSYTKRIVQDAEELFVLLPLREQAHEMERNKDYQAALRLYIRAWNYSRSNTYLIRHIAKIYEVLGDYENSIQWWKILIEKECSAYPLFRCARVYALTCDYNSAIEYFQKAWDQHYSERQSIQGEINLSPQYPGTQEILKYWADTLVATRSIDEAIEKYREVLKSYGGENCDEVFLCMAEVFAEKAVMTKSAIDLDAAKDYCDLVLKGSPENRTAWKLKLKLSRIRI